MRPVASIRAPPQTMFGLAREIRTSWKVLIALQVVDEIGASVQLAPKFVERQTPWRPTAQRKSGDEFDLAILVMKGALAEPRSASPVVADCQVAPPSSERARPLYCEPPIILSGSSKCHDVS